MAPTKRHRPNRSETPLTTRPRSMPLWRPDAGLGIGWGLFTLESPSVVGAAGGDRTHDPWLRRPILYPLSYSRNALNSIRLFRPFPCGQAPSVCRPALSPPEDTMSDHAHEHHTGPIKTPSQLLWTSFFAFVAPIFIIIGLVYFVTSGNKPAMGAADPELAIAERIQRVGTVELRDANRPLALGEAVYAAQCVACHAAGVAGAPKFGDAAAWAPRIATGYEALLTSALKGKGAMGAQGGGAYRDVEIGRAVVHLANAAGGKFEVPQAAPDAAAAPAAAPAAAAPAPATVV
eukprot:gene5796-7855_t